MGKKIAPVTINTFQENFIEEPGKTKTIALCRIADPSILTTISVGTPCTLIVKQHRISVETEQGNIYVGSLPTIFRTIFQNLLLVGINIKPSSNQ